MTQGTQARGGTISSAETRGEARGEKEQQTHFGQLTVLPAEGRMGTAARDAYVTSAPGPRGPAP